LNWTIERERERERERELIKAIEKERRRKIVTLEKKH
jgi:hypothetical protein